MNIYKALISSFSNSKITLIKDELIDYCIKDTCEKNSVPELANFISYRISNDLAFTSIASASYHENSIIFSKPLWESMSFEHKTFTVAHETCHLIAFFLYGGKLSNDHGREWRECMERAKYTPYVYFDELKNKEKLYEIACNCTSLRYSKKTIEYLLSSLASTVCPKCCAQLVVPESM